MKLKDWLEANKITNTEFASKTGVSLSYVTMLVRGTTWPSRDVVKRISKFTRGAVTANDFL